MLFVIFLAGFSLGVSVPDTVQECMMGNGRPVNVLPQLNSLLFCGPIPAGV